MYSTPAATLSSGVSSRLGAEEADDGTLVEELMLREVRMEEEVYGGGGVISLLRGLLRMTA